MHPHSYTIDSLSKSQDLASAILASSTPAHIASVCASIESFLHSRTPDQSRHFFSLTFPTLICKLYGFDDAASSSSPTGPHRLPPPTPPPPPPPPSSGGWIDIILQSNDPVLASRVFNLLSPNGTLFSSISAVDRQSLVKYVFPNERLPEWTRFLLSNAKDCQLLNNLCTFFKGKVKEDLTKGTLCYQVQLNVFEYFMFWFAYYPVCKGNCDNLSNSSVKRPRRFNLENWASSFPRFSGCKRGSEQKLECNLYLRLLYAYLRAFVPIIDLGSLQPYRSSLLHHGYGNDGSILFRAEFFVDTLVHYWLVDNDFSPLPVNVYKSFGLSILLHSVLGDTPRTANLGEVVNLLVKYLNLSAAEVREGFAPGESSRWSRVSLGLMDGKSREFTVSVSNSMHEVGSWNLWIQRSVYRFILRAFLFCPVGASIKNASQVFMVWVSYMEPWNIGLDDFADLDAIVDGSLKGVKEGGATNKEPGYLSLWQGYVLSNYLYYSSLVLHFIGFAHKFLHTDPEVIVQMLLKVMNILTSSKEMVDLIKNVDTAFHTKQAGSGNSVLNSLYGHIPLICEQLQDWEDGLCESDADGSFLHENWNKDLRLFSDGEDGGQHLLQLFILRAEAELQGNSGDNLVENLRHIGSLKERMNCLFGGHTVNQMSVASEAIRFEQSRYEIFRPRRVGNKALVDIKYKGDWMKRPISDDEVGWLANLLVWLSTWLNESLGLSQPKAESCNMGPKCSYVEPPIDVEREPAETAKMVLYAIGSWFSMLGATMIELMRKHGLRINLRMLASKKVMMVLFVCALFSILKKVFGLFYRV